MRGTKRERSKDVWELRVYLGRDPLPPHRKRERSRTFHGGKREAESALAELVAEIRAERPAVATEGTVAYLFEHWLAFLEPRRSPTTLRGYRDKVKNHILPTLGDHQLRKLKAKDIDDLYAALLTRQPKPLAPASVRQVHAILHRALEQAIVWDWLDVNPADKASRVHVPKRAHNLPDMDDVVAMLERAAVHRPDLAATWWLLASIGARRGEVLALRWRDVDLDAGTLRISAAIIKANGTVGEKDTKSHGIRTVEIDPGTVDVLRHHRAWAVAQAEGVNRKIGPASYVFSPDPGHRIPWYPDSISAAWRSTADAAGLDGMRLHDLRHLAASVLLDAGESIAAVSHRLGHERVSTTLDIYASVMPGSGRQLADRMGLAMKRKPRPPELTA